MLIFLLSMGLSARLKISTTERAEMVISDFRGQTVAIVNNAIYSFLIQRAKLSI